MAPSTKSSIFRSCEQYQDCYETDTPDANPDAAYNVKSLPSDNMNIRYIRKYRIF